VGNDDGGVRITDARGSVAAFVAIKRDITGQRREREELFHLANHDPLTGLFNRRRFEDRLRHAIQRHARLPRPMALMLLDLDHFKDVNDTLGHPVGDAVLQEAAARMLAQVREGDTVARLGGDEFAILLESIQNTDDARAVAERLRHSLAQPYVPVGPDPVVSASIGVVPYAPQLSDPGEWLAQADTALYRAKSRGRNRVELIDSAVATGDDAAVA